MFTKKLGELREGPDQGDTEWFWPRQSDNPPYFTLPEWPVDIISHSQLDGELNAQSNYRKGMAPDFPDPRNDLDFDLTRPEFLPFSDATAKLPFEFIIKGLESGRKRIDHFRNKPSTGNKLINPEDLDLFEAKIDMCIKEIEGVRNNLFSDSTVSLSYSSISDAALQLSKIEVPSVTLEEAKDIGREEDGRIFVRLGLTAKPAHLFGRLGGLGYQRGLSYQKMLYEHAKHIYANDRTHLSKEHQDWWEKVFAFDACHEIGAMGHMPSGQLDVYHGPGTDMEVLIELKTSDLNGWIWGDMYSVVLLIPTNDLRKENFKNVVASITN